MQLRTAWPVPHGLVRPSGFLKPPGRCFILGNTLSDNGAVTRGICKVENGYLTDVVETSGIEKLPGGGAAVPGEDGKPVPVDAKSYVSFFIDNHNSVTHIYKFFQKKKDAGLFFGIPFIKSYSFAVFSFS